VHKDLPRPTNGQSLISVPVASGLAALSKRAPPTQISIAHPDLLVHGPNSGHNWQLDRGSTLNIPGHAVFLAGHDLDGVNWPNCHAVVECGGPPTGLMSNIQIEAGADVCDITDADANWNPGQGA
jgi:hypothetical protein